MEVDKAAVPLRIDIVSDIVCPWCVIGYLQLLEVLEQLSGLLSPDIHWHPYELNPQMPEAGQNLREHIAQKYGTTLAQSGAARARPTAIGAALGFRFDYHDAMRMVNTFRAHQLMDWAGEQGRQCELAMELFAAFFSRREDVNDTQVLVSAAGSVGLSGDEAGRILATGAREARVRGEQARWLDRGVYAVPTFFFNDGYPITGAQEAGHWRKRLQKVVEAA